MGDGYQTTEVPVAPEWDEPERDASRSPLVSGVLLHEAAQQSAGVMIAQLVALVGEYHNPLLAFDDETSARVAQSVVDLHGGHIGKSVVVAFERGLRDHPIVIGVLRGIAGWPVDPPPLQVMVDSDNSRLLIETGHELTLRCGKSSITMTYDGHITLRGMQIISHSDGANCIRGGSIQLN